MHYYHFNVGDYTSHTRGLSLLEDLAYRRLLDAYYLNERPFNGCSTDVAREIGMREYEDEVAYVLRKFFPKNNDGEWSNKRADLELRNYKKKKKSASLAGKASGRARQDKASERPLNDRSTDVELTINQEPLTKNQEPEDKISANADIRVPQSGTPVNGCPYKKIVELYHEKLPMLPRVARLTENRKASIRARWNAELPDLETWGVYFGVVAKSRFLTGRTDPGPGRYKPFVADIDFLVRPSTVTKIEEGKYRD